MSDLLDDVIAAHGGLARWKAFATVQATIVTGGAFWGMKGLVQDPKPRLMRVKLHEEWSSVAPFGAPDMLTDFTPDRIAILKTDGAVVAERSNPRETFEGHDQKTPWDPLHRAYFNGYALWTYLTTPFLLAVNGVQTAEIEPWREGVETWRVLRALFPSTIASHSAVQDFFFGEDLLLRRHDYNVDIAGGFAAAQLVFAYVEADGVKLPTQRRAYIRGPDHRPALDPLRVSIDISEVRFE
jgi:hypothetical protein